MYNKKRILSLFFILIFIWSIWITQAEKQKFVNLPAWIWQKVYLDPYKIINNTNKKIFAPITNSANKILWNVAWTFDSVTWKMKFPFMNSSQKSKFENYFNNSSKEFWFWLWSWDWSSY